MRHAWRAGGLRRLRALALFSAAALLSGCAFDPPLEPGALSASNAPVRVRQVPFFAQTEQQCGPAALAGVLGASGVATDPAALSPQVYLPAREGSLQIELLAATRRASRLPYVLAPEPRALLAELQAGRPVLVLQNLRTPHFPVWHYAVLTGFDAARSRLYLNSGTEAGLAVPARAFLRSWDRAGRWAMVSLRPGELPASADATAYLDAANAFARVADADAAALVWRAGATTWPAEPLPHLALGNLAWRAGDPGRAARHYRDGLAHHAEDPALLNNLASVLGESGCPRQAEALLRPATMRLPRESPWRPRVEATLSELAARPGADRLSCAAGP